MSGYADPHATQTQPIAIGERGGPRDRGLSWHGGASSPLACPRAPVIGSMPVPSRLASNIPPLTLPASYDVSSARAGAVRTASFDAPPAAGAGALLNRLRVDSTDGPAPAAALSPERPAPILSVLESPEFRSDLAARPRRGTSDEVEVDLADDEDGFFGDAEDHADAQLHQS